MNSEIDDDDDRSDGESFEMMLETLKAYIKNNDYTSLNNYYIEEYDVTKEQVIAGFIELSNSVGEQMNLSQKDKLNYTVTLKKMEDNVLSSLIYNRIGDINILIKNAIKKDDFDEYTKYVDEYFSIQKVNDIRSIIYDIMPHWSTTCKGKFEYLMYCHTSFINNKSKNKSIEKVNDIKYELTTGKNKIISLDKYAVCTPDDKMYTILIIISCLFCEESLDICIDFTSYCGFDIMTIHQEKTLNLCDPNDIDCGVTCTNICFALDTILSKYDTWCHIPFFQYLVLWTYVYNHDLAEYAEKDILAIQLVYKEADEQIKEWINICIVTNTADKLMDIMDDNICLNLTKKDVFFVLENLNVDLKADSLDGLVKRSNFMEKLNEIYKDDDLQDNIIIRLLNMWHDYHF